MMKNQLAGLMKQAQQMQDNMKKAQEELAQIEVEGQSGAGLVKVVMTCRHDVKRVTIDPSLLTRTRTCWRTWSRRRSTTPCAGRGHDAGEDGGLTRACRAAGLQAAVLTGHVGPIARSASVHAFEPVSGLDELAQALRCLPGVGPKAAQRMALHLLQHDRDGAARLASALSTRPRARPPLRALQHVHRGRALRALPVGASATRRCSASSRRRPIC